MNTYLPKIVFALLLLLLVENKAISQDKVVLEQDKAFQLSDSLWNNPTSFFNINDENWRALCSNLDDIDLDDLNSVSHSIFYGQDAKILNHTNTSISI